MLEVIGGTFILSSDSTAGNNGNRLSFDTVSGYGGVGTSTPQWLLNLATSTRPQLTLSDGSSSASPFNFRSINNSFYISTSSPTTFATTTSSILTLNNATGSTTLIKLDVSGTATSSFGNGINIATGCFAVNGTCLASGISSYDAWTHPNTLGYSATTSVMGIGTTTPQWNLTIASSTRPQLTLADGSSTAAPFNFRSINGNFYLSTSSPSTFATSGSLSCPYFQK
jgi:hypothetical protein